MTDGGALGASPPSAVMADTHKSIPPAVSPETRKQQLARAIEMQITRSMRIESRSDYQAVLVFGSKPNHLLHFFIGLFTIGLWWIVWLILALSSDETRRLLTVTETGAVTARDY